MNQYFSILLATCLSGSIFASPKAKLRTAQIEDSTPEEASSDKEYLFVGLNRRVLLQNRSILSVVQQVQNQLERMSEIEQSACQDAADNSMTIIYQLQDIYSLISQIEDIILDTQTFLENSTVHISNQIGYLQEEFDIVQNNIDTNNDIINSKLDVILQQLN